MTKEIEEMILQEMNHEDNNIVVMLDEARDIVLDTIIGIDEETGEIDPLVEPLF